MRSRVFQLVCVLSLVCALLIPSVCNAAEGENSHTSPEGKRSSSGWLSACVVCLWLLSKCVPSCVCGLLGVGRARFRLSKNRTAVRVNKCAVLSVCLSVTLSSALAFAFPFLAHPLLLPFPLSYTVFLLLQNGDSSCWSLSPRAWWSPSRCPLLCSGSSVPHGRRGDTT
jgi:hypothetical protein